MKTHRLATAGTISLLVLASCSSGDSPTKVPAGPEPAVLVTVEPSSGSVTVSETLQFRANVRDAGGNQLSGRVVTWSSTDTGTATVSSTGLVTGIAEGSANISAAVEGLTATATIAVAPAPVASITIRPATAMVEVGDTLRLTARLADASGNELSGRTVSWSTIDSAVADVSSFGLVTALAPGTAVIVASSGERQAAAYLTIRDVPIADISLEPTRAELLIGDTLRLAATVRTEAGTILTGRPVSWASSDTTVADVSATGLVRAKATGNTTIVAASSGIVATAAISIRADVQLVLSERSILMSSLGDVVDLDASVRGNDGSVSRPESIDWASDDESIARVSNQGRVTSVANGHAKIRASVIWLGRDTLNAEVDVQIRQEPTAIELSDNDVKLESLGESHCLSASVKDARGNELSEVAVVWQSRNPEVATVTESGTIRAVHEGSTEIVASHNSLAATALVVVEQVPHSIDLPRRDLHFTSTFDTTTLGATVVDAGGAMLRIQPRISWSSSDESVATVSESGTVTAIANGNTTVTAASGRLSEGVSVTVSPEPVTIEVSRSNLAFSWIGQVDTVFAVVTDGGGTAIPGAPVAWSTTDTTVATVLDGVLLAVGNGSATVTATSGDAYARITVTVSQVAATLALSPDSVELSSIGASDTITSVVLDPGGTPLEAQPTTTWSSSDPSTVTVDNRGTVTAVSGGKARVLAISRDLSASAEVTVTPQPATISLDKDLVSFEAVGEADTLTVLVTDAGGTVLNNAVVEWSSTDPLVATVAGGIVVAAGNGTTTVTASSGSVSTAVGVTVAQRASGMTVMPGKTTLTAVGTTQQLSATVVDAGGTALQPQPSVAWTSAKPEVASVSATGLVTALTHGASTITAISGSLAVSVDVSVMLAFYRDANNVTIRCPDADFGDTGVVDGITYKKVTGQELYQLVDDQDGPGIETACTSGVGFMGRLFEGWLGPERTPDISTWDVSAVYSMTAMFQDAQMNPMDTSKWDVSTVTDMSFMFFRAIASPNTDSWDVSSVTDMRWMFARSRNSSNISAWNTSSVTSMERMFYATQYFNRDISAWDVSNVTNMNAMFSSAAAFNQDLSRWCVRKIGLKPSEFDAHANSWTLPRPPWGTCPQRP